MSEEKNGVELSETIFDPVMSSDQAIQSWKTFQENKKKILDSSDYVMIRVNSKREDGSWDNKENPFIRKSGWNKLACFYGVSTETTKYKKINNDDGSYVYIVSVRAYSKLPDGREYSTERSAAVSSIEKEKTEGMKKSPRKEHDVIASAETRAEGRALAAFFGTGEVSAEEMLASNDPSSSSSGPKKADAVEVCTCQPSERKPSEEKDGKLSCEVCGKQLSHIVTQAILAKKAKDAS